MTRTRVLWGAVDAGEANGSYAGANRQFQAIVPRFSLAGLFDRSRWPTMSADAAVRVLRSEWREAFAEVRAGAHGDRVVRQHAWDCSLTPSLVLFECYCLRREQRPVEAVRTWLDAVAMELDSFYCQPVPSHLSQAAVRIQQLATGWRDDELRALDPASRRELAHGLRAVDERLSEPFDPEWLLASVAATVLDPSRAAASEGFRKRTLRWLSGHATGRGSARPVARAIDSLDRLTPAAADWPSRRQQFQAFQAACSDRTDVLDGVGAMLVEIEVARRCALATVRLLRIAVDVHSGREPAELPDPMAATPLSIEQRAGGLELRSAGSDSVIVRIVAK